MAVWEFNTGEWTEAYVFLRLLGDGRIFGASADLIRDEQTYIDVINIIRDEPNSFIKFERFIEDELANPTFFINLIFYEEKKTITINESKKIFYFFFHI